MKKRFVIIHYNTPYLTECLVKSINLHVEDAIIYIFDNSDKFPFISSFENVTIYDNTNGQIIDFDKWLEKYPKKKYSHGKSNNYGSAKHCYSVEKCMELIKEPFILLDSDVLLKKDVSNLFNDEFVYIGESIVQPKSTIKRVLPFLCFINVTKCIDNDIHYFNENYMHGLYCNSVNKTSDLYDTGAFFFLDTRKYAYKEIKLDDYIVHFGHGSWNKKGVKKPFDEKEWLINNKKYFIKDMNKKVVYTCISGKYDSLIEPKYVSEGFDYICFTDNKNFKSNIWQIRSLPEGIDDLSQVKKQRYVKINPHKLLSEYDISIWVDGNVIIKGDLNEFIDENIHDGCSIYVPKHPYRNCIYSEAKVVKMMKKDTEENVDKQTERYKNCGFPKHYGLLQSNILLRKHNDKKCISFMEEWFNELKNGSHRDQLSFNYVSWVNKDTEVYYLDKNIYNSKWFKWTGGHSFTEKSNDESNNDATRNDSNNTTRNDSNNNTENNSKENTENNSKENTVKKPNTLSNRLKLKRISVNPLEGY